MNRLKKFLLDVFEEERSTHVFIMRCKNCGTRFEHQQTMKGRVFTDRAAMFHLKGTKHDCSVDEMGYAEVIGMKVGGL